MVRIRKEWYPNVYKVCPCTITDDDGTQREEYYLLLEDGSIATREQMFDLFEKIQGFYNTKDVDEMIDRENKTSSIERWLSYQQWDSGVDSESKYSRPKAEYRFKKFKAERNWSCKCAWCGKRVSSKTDEGYFLVHNQTLHINERGCSEACIELLWKEAFVNTIHERGWQKYFSEMEVGEDVRKYQEK